ncbi:MAG: methyltransferase domain-containing protein [Patescibacteria group bacterium]|jgi:ubiquinone/menaquinone biosynthesis C-methylase UbiE/uncharacterized protein YbaR (Trm112 family)
MNQELLKYLCCPKCKTNLVGGGDFLVCSKCNQSYKTVDDVVILVDLDNLPDHLQKQIVYFTNESDCRLEYQLVAWQKSYLEKFIRNSGEIKNKLVVDCGTGSGYLAIELAKLGAEVIATDLTLKNLLELQRAAKQLKLEDKITLVCCDAQELPFSNNLADYFISNAVLEHLPREQQAIDEINRVCKTDSVLMVTVPLSYKYLNPLFILLNYIHDKRIGHLRRYNKKILANKFNNWSLVSSYYTGHFGKTIKLLANILVPWFNQEAIEKSDAGKENKKWGAINIICFFQKNNKI